MTEDKKIHIEFHKAPDPPPTHITRAELCRAGHHRWAHLVRGGQACGYCGTPRP